MHKLHTVYCMLKILVPSVNNYLLQISQSVLPFQSSGEDHAVQEADEHSLPLLIKLNYKHLSFSVPVFNFSYKKKLANLSVPKSNMKYVWQNKWQIMVWYRRTVYFIVHCGTSCVAVHLISRIYCRLTKKNPSMGNNGIAEMFHNPHTLRAVNIL